MAAVAAIAAIIANQDEGPADRRDTGSTRAGLSAWRRIHHNLTALGIESSLAGPYKHAADAGERLAVGRIAEPPDIVVRVGGCGCHTRGEVMDAIYAGAGEIPCLVQFMEDTGAAGGTAVS